MQIAELDDLDGDVFPSRIPFFLPSAIDDAKPASSDLFEQTIVAEHGTR